VKITPSLEALQGRLHRHRHRSPFRVENPDFSAGAQTFPAEWRYFNSAPGPLQIQNHSILFYFLGVIDSKSNAGNRTPNHSPPISGEHLEDPLAKDRRES
jgi:hypothetical protein